MPPAARFFGALLARRGVLPAFTAVQGVSLSFPAMSWSREGGRNVRSGEPDEVALRHGREP
jgi:hypothetical protein